MKSKVYRCCVRSAILYGSEAWCLKENEKAILRRTERAIVRAMCGQKVVCQKYDRRKDGHVGVEENYRPVGSNEWSQMIWTCAQKG